MNKDAAGAAEPREVRLSANENPYGPGRLVEAALRDAMRHVAEYPDVGALTRMVAARWEVPETCATVATGADDLLRRAVDLTRGAVVAAWPGFTVYQDLAVARGRPFIAASLAADGSASAQTLYAAAREEEEHGRPPGVLFAANPNNPTGVGTARASLVDLARRLPAWLVVIDEAYADFRPVPDPERLDAPWPDNAVIARTLSKIYGLAGLRVGYAVGQGWGIEGLRRLGDPIPVGTLSVAAARAALDPANRARLARVRAAVLGRRAQLTQALTARGFSVLPSETNFVLATPPPPVDADRLALDLRAQGILVRLGSRLHVPGTIRISVGAGWQHRRLLVALDGLLRTYGAPVQAAAGGYHAE